MNSGIYLIRNRRTKATYVGATSNFSRRRAEHICDLRNGKHFNKKLAAAFTPFNPDEFEFSELEQCEDEQQGNKEREWMLAIKPSCQRPVNVVRWLSPARPPINRPKSILVSFRIDEDAAAALDKARGKLGVISFSASDAAREILLRKLKADGLL